jgi:hypothetical protein
VVKKPKKISYKKALAVTKASIPELDTSPSTQQSQVSNSSSTSSLVLPAYVEPPRSAVIATRSSDDFAIDLTGEVSLKSYHTSAPLFQTTPETRSTRASAKEKEKAQKKRSLATQELELDIDAITLHIVINQKMEKFQIKPEDRFFEILKAISERHNVQVSSVLLFNEKEKRILPEDTPNKIGHKISSIYSKLIIFIN